MQINGFELALSREDLEHRLNDQAITIELLGKTSGAYKSLAEGDKKALAHLVRAAEIMTDVALEMDHPQNLSQKKALEEAALSSPYAALALRLFNSFQGLAALNGVDPEPVELFKGLHLLPAHNFYPQDLSREEFHRILLKMFADGQIEEIRKILSARTMVRRDKDRLKAIDYTQYFAPQFSQIANELECAAHYATDAAFKDYLGWQAQALLQNNEDMDMLADKHWAVLQNTPLEFTISRENYDDEMTPTVLENPKLAGLIEQHRIEVVSKDMLGVRVGIVNAKGTELILRFKSLLPQLARLMPYAERYRQRLLDQEEIKQTMVDVDLVALSGDYAQCRGGITTAQNLPNNDKLAVKTGGGRRNVYHRQVRQTEDKERTKKLLEHLVSPELHAYYDLEALHLFVIGHENGHSLGPDSDYQNALGLYGHIIEEHKADVISVAMMPEYVKAGVIDRETLYKVYATWIISSLLLRAEPQLSHPHRVADLIQFNYLLEHGVLSFSKDEKLKIDFLKLPDVMNQLLEETIAVQLSKSPEFAKRFIDNYARWGEVSRRIAAVQRQLGLKPYKLIKSKF